MNRPKSLVIDSRTDEAYKDQTVCPVDPINFMTVVMTMMRMVLEVVMVLALVGGLMFAMKVLAKENRPNESLPANDNDDAEKSTEPDSKE